MKNKNVKPIKSLEVLHEVQDTLKNYFRYGMRNYTLFQVGKVTMLRISDLVTLQYQDIYDEYGNVRKHTIIKDKKTNKINHLYLNPVMNELEKYHAYLQQKHITSQWLFPSSEDINKHLSIKMVYKFMKKTGDLLGIDYLGTHTMRKTGAYMVYQQTGNIALVMKLLNHSNEQVTLRYLGIDEATKEATLDQIKFN